MEAHGQKGYKHRYDGSDDKHPPRHIDAVRKIPEPAFHHNICDRESDDDPYGNELQEILREQRDNTGCRRTSTFRIPISRVR